MNTEEGTATAAVPAKGRPVEHACFWLAGRRRQADPPLLGRREADIVIVGAGLTGLWTANFLKTLDPAREIVVLEQGIAAYGASGRNAGMLGEGIDHSHQLAISHFGRREAARLARLGVDNLAGLLRFLEERGIECDLERTGQLQVALNPSQVEELREARDVARRLGLEHYELLNAEATRAELNCARYQAGLFNPHGCILDPVKLVEGLKREATRAGTVFHERTRVTSIERSNGGVRLRTAHLPGAAGTESHMEATGVAADRLQAAASRLKAAAARVRVGIPPGAEGEILARRVILATSAYTHQILPRVQSRFIPLYDYVLASDPLNEEQMSRLGWRRRSGVADMRSFFKYYRLTRDNRIVWGTSEAAYYGGNRVSEAFDHSPKHYAALEESFRRHFPQLANLKFPYRWGGPIASTTRLTPFFGTAAKGRIAYGLGYTGHGIASTRIAGRILAHRVLELPSSLLELEMVRRKPIPFPPEPFRRVGVALVTGALRKVDAGGRPGVLLKALERLG
ncbi:MAG TPA: FAD-dependent oxidoreductase, partial [Candidatus Polarisedimenticolia bacterium]|nr:FAD-dependent oxidoreductase [Candidatus Polarisedimenticolia bacterium]